VGEIIMEAKKIYSETIAKKVIAKFETGGIEGHYFENSQQLIEFLKNLIPKESVIAWGGSMTCVELKVMDFIRSGSFKLLDRDAEKDPVKLMQIFRDSFSADYYFTGTNAITKDGKLVNTDGNGNRVAALCYGPKYVIVIAGTNKIVADEKAAISRIKSLAAPMNAMRLSKPTPCTKTGQCGECYEASICSHTVITRRCSVKGRIKLLLVGENAGF
jgi:hypothetical protein